MVAQMIALMEGVSSASTTVPKLTKTNSNRLSSRMPVLADIAREYVPSDDGQIQVYGADLPNPNMEGNASTGHGEVHEGDGSTTQFDTSITYAAFSNYNWIVVQAGTVIEQGAGAGKFQVSDNSGSARITFGTAPGDGDKVEIFFTVPVALGTQTAAGEAFQQEEITSYDAMWAVLSGSTLGASNVYIKPLVH